MIEIVRQIMFCLLVAATTMLALLALYGLYCAVSMGILEMARVVSRRGRHGS